MLSPDILSLLQPQLEAKKLRLIFAAESGSRAWGFASADSDYDVRFIFAKEKERYLDLYDQLLDIQWKQEPMDFAGWDLKKALHLAHKSNPSLIEWLSSPIQYADSTPGGRTDIPFQFCLKKIVAEYFNPRALAHHYVNFGQNIRGKYLSDWTGEYTAKKYLYAVRPILMIEWMKANSFVLPPISMAVLLDAYPPCELKRQTLDVIKMKAEGKETDGYENQTLNNLIRDWYENGREFADSFKARTFPVEPLNQLFRSFVS